MCETLLGANKKKVGHILKYKAHILNYLRHIFAALKMRIFSGVDNGGAFSGGFTKAVFIAPKMEG